MTTAVHPLTEHENVTILRHLADHGIPVQAETDIDGTAHIWPAREVTVYEEVTCLRAFEVVTDQFVWHQWVKL